MQQREDGCDEIQGEREITDLQVGRDTGAQGDQVRGQHHHGRDADQATGKVSVMARR